MPPSTRTAIILEDERVAATLCGPHDRNIRVFEELFGCPVHVRGNELLLDSDDAAARDTFATMVAELGRFAREGRDVHPELVRASWDSLADPGALFDTLRETGFTIPHGYSRVYPRTLNQARFMRALENHDMVFGIGPAGTGKTYLAIAHALSEVLSHRKRRLILTRPVVEAGENLGFLPGDLTQKLDPYIRPLHDAMASLVPPDIIQRLEETRVLEIAPLAYMRGRSLKDSYVILDEAQNTTREQMKMFLTRLGEGSRAVITGDATQIDLPRPEQSGLAHAERVLADIPEINFCHLTGRDVVRSGLVRTIIRAYERERKEIP